MFEVIFLESVILEKQHKKNLTCVNSQVSGWFSCYNHIVVEYSMT